MALPKEDIQEIATTVAQAVAASRQHDLQETQHQSASQMGDFFQKYFGAIAVLVGVAVAYGVLTGKVDNLEESLTMLTERTERIGDDFNEFRLSGDRWTAQDHQRYADEQSARDGRQESSIADLKARVRVLEGRPAPTGGE
ncbi:hypothetical protein [Henriciella sp.]|uniref:hypothetical protein n=1 Tax=Henriciella sp. TaxID=1968823 RepID=UPI002603CC4D|nr:hypothetical protein [Henriciella sp.]